MQFHLTRKSKKYRSATQRFFATALLLLLVVGGTAPTAKALQAVTRHNLFYRADKATGQLRPYLEVYFEIDPQSILFQKKDSIWQAKVRVDIVVSNSAGVVNEEHYMLETTPVTNGALTLTQRIMDLRRLSVPTGDITINIGFSDQIKKNNDFNLTDSVTANTLTVPSFSDIQILDTAFSYDGESIYKKNNRLQIPLPSDFVEERRNLHYYAELYQPKVTTDAPQTVVRRVYISRKQGDDAMHGIQVIDTIPASQLTNIQGSLPIATLPSGNYYLNMTVQDMERQKLASQSLFFQVLNKKPDVFKAAADTSKQEEPMNYLNMGKTFVAKYTPAQVRAILKMLLPIANFNEKQQINGFLKSTEEMYARYFIYNFWVTKNPTNPERAWTEYTEKVKAVNKQFGSSLKPGYETDRGIVELRFGKPTERITVPSEQGALPYEIWQYNTIPGVAANAVFLFYRYVVAGNNYELLHTTIPGETRNKEWRSMLYVNGQSPDPQNSRAESYLGNR